MRISDWSSDVCSSDLLFDFGNAASPANFLVYDIPVGASEGVHLHNLTDPKLGAFDEFYYIIEGRGKMTIDGESVFVTAGDHVHAPLDSWRGIENIDGGQRLKVFLRSEEHTSELQSLMRISYAVFCLKKKKNSTDNTKHILSLK